MHVIFREAQGLDRAATPVDLAHGPADLVALSFSDSDLAAWAGAVRGMVAHATDSVANATVADATFPRLRLASLADLQHPLSVDTYLEATLAHARVVLVRLIGGVPWWDYGITQLHRLAVERGIALAVLPADGRGDARLDALSTVPVAVLRDLARLCDAGGVAAGAQALRLIAAQGGLTLPALSPEAVLPAAGCWTPEHGVTCPLGDPVTAARRVAVVFYRAWAVAGDTAPVAALIAALRAKGHHARGFFVPSLSAPEAGAWLARQLAAYRPEAILNATGFGTQGASPLDGADVPVFQVAHATSDRAAWEGADRGLSPGDLAMHVVLPEGDGRIFAGAVSFKEKRAEAVVRHAPDAAGVAAAVARVDGWLRLAATPPAERRLALVLSSYPGKGWNMAHAVGLDALASARAILEDLGAAGHVVATPDLTSLDEWSLPLADYAARVPPAMRDAITAVWGAPEDDPDARDGAFRLRAVQAGNVLVALQPERAGQADKDATYHDLTRVPRHAYAAFYLWVQDHADALIHLGAHGTLEWLPGKAVALSDACWPQALTGALPVIYPFIVNDPGEAAQAKRRIGAVTLGHAPPPLRAGGTPQRLARLESLLDEFSNADGLDPARRDRLQGDIRAEAAALGIEDDLGLDRATTLAEAITRIDRFVCDVKDSQFGDGLHVWGRGEDAPGCAEAERAALIAALNGRRIPPGPSGSPHRGRADVLPTGRNLFTVDPRAIPTRAAYAQGERLAAELLRRHLQDHGDWPRGLVVDLWGSATMRTAGEDFAMALRLMGVRPVWDEGSERVSGIEILPLTELGHPRIDVTLRVSGLFRDVFPGLPALHGQAVRMLAARDEAADFNPYVAAPGPRVFGPEPGAYGLGVRTDSLDTEARRAVGQAWLDGSSWALDAGARDAGALAARVAGADAFVHPQDLPESDLLMAADYATHEAGFAAAQGITGGRATLYHLDNTDPARPAARTLPEEIARVVRARAANPAWIAGMMRHGFRGGAEIAMTLDHMAAHQHLAGAVGAHLFDAFFDATLGTAEVVAFLERENPQALAAMQARFAALRDAGLWQTRRNDLAMWGAA